MRLAGAAAASFKVFPVQILAHQLHRAGALAHRGKVERQGAGAIEFAQGVYAVTHAGE
jgi:hypothetical protein